MTVSAAGAPPAWLQSLQQDLSPVQSLFTGGAQAIQGASTDGQIQPASFDTPDAQAGAASLISTLQSPSDQFATNTLGALISAQEQGPSGQAAQLISSLDSNGDGSLNLNEVEAALGQTSASGASSASSASSPLSQAFAQIDANGDGELSQSELAQALQTLDQNQQANQTQGAHHHHHHHGGPPPQDQTAASTTTTAPADALGVSETSSASDASTATASSTSAPA